MFFFLWLRAHICGTLRIAILLFLRTTQRPISRIRNLQISQKLVPHTSSSRALRAACDLPKLGPPKPLFRLKAQAHSCSNLHWPELSAVPRKTELLYSTDFRLLRSSSQQIYIRGCGRLPGPEADSAGEANLTE